MNDNRPYLSVIFPIAGAADNLPLSLIDADRHLRGCGRDYEIIVVGSGYLDKAPESVRRLLPIIGFRLVESSPDKKRWIDTAKRGLDEARGRYRLLCANGAEAEMAELLKLPEFLEKNPEAAGIVLGKRNLGLDLRRFLFSGVHRLLIPEITDPESPFICLNAESADRLTGREIGNSEIHLIFAARSGGIKLAEIPVTVKNQPHKIGAKETAKIIWRALQIKTGNFFERILGKSKNLLEKVSKKSPYGASSEGGKDQREI